MNIPNGLSKEIITDYVELTEIDSLGIYSVLTLTVELGWLNYLP